MLHHRGKARQPRSGVVVLFVAVCLVALLGVAAISLDGGQIVSERERAQATADAAALAAASDLYYNYLVNNGLDMQGSATASALSTAAANGYTNDGTNSVITPNALDVTTGKPLHGIWMPPISGDYAGRPGYVEVVVQYNVKRSFSKIFGTGTMPVRARTVALGTALASEAGILVLDPSAKGALNAQGGGNVNVSGTPIIVDSNNQDAMLVGGGGNLTDTDKGFFLTGNYSISGSGGNVVGPVYTGRKPTPDPLADLPPPDPTKMVIRSTKKTQQTNGIVTLNPGVYQGGISVSGTANLTLNPGIYYMDGGGFSFSGQGSLTAQGVMIYSAPGNGNSGGISVSGQGSMIISAPTSGIYQGITFWQERSSTVPGNVQGTGGTTSMTGTFYFAGATLNVSGNGGVSNIGSQYISNQLQLGGTGGINISWSPGLVAHKRSIYLVE